MRPELFFSELGQNFISEQMRHLERIYKEGNPLAVLRAWLLAKREGIVAPRWVEEALETCFSRALEIQGEDAGQKFLDAFGLAGPGPSAFSRFRDQEEKLWGALAVEVLRKKRGLTVEQACERASEALSAERAGRSPGRVKQWYYELRDTLSH